MPFWELFLISVGLAADAFAVAMCRGLEAKRFTWKNGLLTGLFFGFFQAAMPVIGYYLATLFADEISAFDHWIAFGLLTFLGAKMIYEGIKEERRKRREKAPKAADNGSSTESSESEAQENAARSERVPFRMRELVVMSFATSIDALIVGVTFAFLDTDIWTSVSLIGAVTFALSLFGVFLGSKIGKKLGGKAEIVGGVILIAIGLKILLEHLEIVSF